MNKLSLRSPVLTPSSNVELDPTVQWLRSERMSCLIILVPANSDCASFTRRICDLAKETNSFIRLLGLYRDTSEELALRRELAMMSALIRTAKIFVETIVEKGTNWLEAVKHIHQSGDLIVCTMDQTIGMRRRPLSQILESNFKTRIYILSKPQLQLEANILSQAIVWLGLVAIVAGFLFLEVKVVQASSGGFQTLLFILLLIPEFWLLKVWNSLFP